MRYIKTFEGDFFENVFRIGDVVKLRNESKVGRYGTGFFIIEDIDVFDREKFKNVRGKNSYLLRDLNRESKKDLIGWSSAADIRHLDDYEKFEYDAQKYNL